MDPLTRFKLALAVVAAVLFGLSMRVDQDWLRWLAIGLLAAAVVLRFFTPRPRQ